MFTPRRFKPTKPQKRRSWVSSSIGVFIKNWQQHPGVFALNSGYMALRLVEYVYIWLKRISKYPSSSVRFAVTLQAGMQVTRKPENVRMGKGKGVRKAMRAFVHTGTFLFRITSIRAGILNFLLRKLQARVPFKLGIYRGLTNLGISGTPYTWIQNHMVQKKYIVKELERFKTLLKKTHRPIILGYIYRIFRWRYIVPYAIWSPVPKGVSKLRLKRSYLLARKLVTYAAPQSLGFVRQIRTQWREMMQKGQKFSLPVWQRIQARWFLPTKNVRVFLNTPLLPWDILLRAKRFKRILVYINFISFFPLVSTLSKKAHSAWEPLTLKEGELVPDLIKRRIRIQLRVATLIEYWRYLMGRPVVFSAFL